MALRLSLLVAAVLVATVVATPANVRVVSLNDRLADPVNYGQTFGVTPDPTPSQGPNANVFYLPSARSAALSPAIDAGTQQLTLTTLPAAIGAPALPTTLVFALAAVGGDCTTASVAAAGLATPTSTAVVAAGDVRTYTFTVPTGTANPGAWNSQALEFETALGRNGAGRKLCIGTPTPAGPATTYKWTGLYIRVAWDCALASGPATQQCSQILADSTTRTFPTLSALEFLSLDGSRVRTTCCKSTTGLGVGVCVNPRAQTCCGGNPVSSGEKCCSVNTEVVTFDSSPCPCRASQQVLNTTTQRIVNTDCNEPLGTSSTNLFAADQCCLPSVARFPELRDDATGGLRIESGFSGYCYSTNGPLKCCDTGELYDPGSQQCCVINGLQNATVPCVCSTDAHCLGAQTDFHTSTQRCCRGTFPDVPAPQGAEVCTAYANFPFQVGTAATGGLPALPGQQVTIPPAAQRCFGTCIDTNFQICCNGVACARNFERCCNTTCCNRFTATCRFGVAQAPNGSPFNSVNFRQTTVRCSSVYYLHGLRSFFIFALPGFLLLSTLLGLAVVLVFANKASNRSYSFIESGMILFAIIAIVFALPLFFSPAFKYGVVIVLVGLTAILSAAARVRSLNVLALAGIILALLYVFDPFTGNQYLNFVSFRAMSTGFTGRAGTGTTGPLVQVPGQPDYKTNGLLHLITNMWRDNQEFCVNFYDYFRLDDTLLDFDRFDNPSETTYGYCRRGWVFALLIFEIIMMGALIILLVVTLLALLLRFRKAADLAPVELEVKML